MSEDIVLLFMYILVGVILLILSLIMYYAPPSKINWMIGYRTRRSMKDDDSWKTAQKYSAKVMLIISVICIIVGAAVWVVWPEDWTAMLVVMSIQVVLLVMVIPITEYHLKKMD